MGFSLDNAAFRIVAEFLKLRNKKEDRKYLDEMIKLRKEWYEEYTKDISIRSNVVLDDRRNRLRLLETAISSSIGNAGIGDK